MNPPPAPQGGAADPAWARLLRLRPLPHEIAALVWLTACVIVLERLPVTYPRTALLFAYTRFGAAVLTIGLVTLVAVRLLRKSGRGTLWQEALSLVRLGTGLLFVMAGHFVVKSFIHLINPRVHDSTLLSLDGWIHFGVDPGVFLTTLVDSPLLLGALDFSYTAVYLVVLVASTAVLLVTGPPARRHAFAAAYAFLWMLGLVLYVAYPSWGPVFVVPDAHEKVLQHMPATVHVQSVLFEEIRTLVEAPLAPRSARFGCVAAFPSLHVAVIALIAIATRRIRGWRVFIFVFLGIMIVGSVVTGYHYLVDAWAGIALAGLAWFLGCRCSGPWDVPAAPVSQAAADPPPPDPAGAR